MVTVIALALWMVGIAGISLRKDTFQEMARAE
jgi:hypothetical protein